MKYYQATVTTTSDFADTLSVFLMDFGSEGVSVTDGRDVAKVLSEHNWDYVDSSLEKADDGLAYVSGYYPEDYDFAPLAEELNRLRGLTDVNVGSLELDLTKIDSADYENEWKKYYKPIELDKIVVVPEWIDYRGDKIQVRIDPGMAFGTGSHETTGLCLRFLERVGVEGKRVADVGCGSGILGIAAVRLGAESCVMSDVDMQAVESARKNCALNGVSERVEVRLGSLGENENYDVIVANITADVLISLADLFYASLESGGRLITSGIIHSRADDLKNVFNGKFNLEETEINGEWIGYVWSKRKKSA